MIRIAKIELVKYIRGFTIIIICFVLAETVLLSRIEAKGFFESGIFDFSTFKIVNYHFVSLIVSAIPLTIILTVSNEFSSGYASKLISNGLSRNYYSASKYILGSALSVIATLLYITMIVSFLLFKKVNHFDKVLFVNSTILTFLFSIFFSCIIVSISLLIRSWQYAVLAYYGYFITESFIVYQFDKKLPWVEYLPFHLAVSIFQLQKNLSSLDNYLLAGGILFFSCFIVVIISHYYFKRADL
jgi:hypothetical protein